MQSNGGIFRMQDRLAIPAFVLLMSGLYEHCESTNCRNLRCFVSGDKNSPIFSYNREETRGVLTMSYTDSSTYRSVQTASMDHVWM